MTPFKEARDAMCRAWHGPDWDGITDLYSAEQGLVAALPPICKDIAKQLDLTPSQCKDGDYSEGYLDAMVACTLLVRRYSARTIKPPGLWHDSASSATGPDSTAGTP